MQTVELDPRWLDAALSLKDLSVVLELCTTGNTKLWQFLDAQVEEALAKKKWDPAHELDDVFQALIRTGFPKVVERFVSVVRRSVQSGNHWWAMYYTTRQIPTLPIEAVAPLEALIPSLEARSVDAFVSAIDELKQKHKTVEA